MNRKRRFIALLATTSAILVSLSLLPSPPEASAATCGNGLSVLIGTEQSSRSRTATAGGPNLLWRYSVTLQPGANAFISVSVKGFTGSHAVWYGVGTFDGGTFSRTVPWGNNLAHPEIRVYNAGPAAAPAVDWSCGHGGYAA